jgi:hypothetical protein
MRQFKQNLIHIFLTFGLFSMNFENWMNGKCVSNISFVVLLEHEVRRDPATSEENRSRCWGRGGRRGFTGAVRTPEVAQTSSASSRTVQDLRAWDDFIPYMQQQWRLARLEDGDAGSEELANDTARGWCRRAGLTNSTGR